MQTPTVHALSYLDGQHIVRWLGTEMALGEGQQTRVWNEAEATWQVEYGPPVWAHPSIPFLQLTHIDVQLRNGTLARLLSQLDDGSGHCGLYLIEIDALVTFRDEEPGCIFRVRELTELPVGLATVTLVRQDGPHAVVDAHITVNGQQIRLLAAEVHERADGVFDLVERDESLLLQLDGARPAQTP